MKPFFILLVFAQSASSSTYYIDFAGGADGNSGASTASPWKRHPYMAGFAGSYTHQPGDRFVFKGGVTWPGSCWLMNITAGGTPQNQDYYGVDGAWFAGDSWSRPIFDNGQCGTVTIRVQQNLPVIIDGIDFTNALQTFNVDVVAGYYVTITNCWFHGWRHTAAQDDSSGASGGVKNNPVGGSRPAGVTNVIITHCTIDNIDGDANCGTCVGGFGEVAFCKIGNAPGLIMMGGQSIHDCELYNVNESYSGDAALHPNVIYWTGYNGADYPYPNPRIYNNWIHDIRGGGGNLPVIYVEPGFNTTGNGLIDCYIYNNVVNSCTNPAVFPDDEGNPGTATISVHVWNNTFQTVGRPAILTATHGSANYQLLTMTNNHCINDVGAEWSDDAAVFDTEQSGGSLVQTLLQANSQGYTLANFYSSNGSTVGAGTNLSSLWQALGFSTNDTTRGGKRAAGARPSSGGWDIGAYEYSTPVAVKTRVKNGRANTLKIK